MEDGKGSIDIRREDEVLLRSEINIAGSWWNLPDGCDMPCSRIDSD